MDIYEAIKAKALHSVLKPNTDYHLRRIFRWYSKTFHTPLQEVFDIPIEYVLQEYFEERYENMEDHELDLILQELIETDEQRKQRLSKDEQDKKTEDELLQMSKKANQEAVQKKAKDLQNAKAIINKLPKQIHKLSKAVKEVSESIKEDMKTDPEVAPDIDIKFEDDAEFERLLNSDSNMLTTDTNKKP